MKKTVLILISLLTPLILGVNVSAQESRSDSNEVRTRVGEPKEQGGPVLEWGMLINETLEIGNGSRYNKMVKTITNGNYTAPTSIGSSEANQYWCTFLVIDAFNLAGHSGLSRTAGHGAVVGMARFWSNTPTGYVFVDYLNDNRRIADVQPGYAVFWVTDRSLNHTGSEHTALVIEITTDSRGNGRLTTIDSNSYNKSNTYVISDWKIVNQPYNYTYGFGGVN